MIKIVFLFFVLVCLYPLFSRGLDLLLQHLLYLVKGIILLLTYVVAGIIRGSRKVLKWVKNLL